MPDTSNQTNTAAIVLCISGHDPSGGAGLQADIEAVSACGGYANTIPSCLTVQSHRKVHRVQPVDIDIIRESLDCLMDSAKPDSIKIGLLGHPEQADVLREWLQTMTHPIPVVLDPVTRATDGSQLSHEALIHAIKTSLLPYTTLLTPNHFEVRQLAGVDNTEEALRQIFSSGCQNILLTGGDERYEDVCNTLYNPDGLCQQWRFNRLPGAFHGSGCTLAAAVATYLALGQEIQVACGLAQDFTQRTLAQAISLSTPPQIPRRRLQ